MANHSVITLEKPMHHLGLGDWYGRVTQLKNVADARRQNAWELRHKSRTLRNETNIEAEWNNYNTNMSLSDRIGDIDRWRITVQKLLDRIVGEMNLLKDEKANTELELEGLVTPLKVVADCLSTRDCRLGSELTFDEGDTELRKELCVIENNQQLLREQCQRCWEKLNRLAEVKFQLENELTNKSEAQIIDSSQLALDKNCSLLTYKPNPTRRPRNSCTFEEWMEHTKNMKLMGENELADTYNLRESVFVCREKARNIMKAQQDRTDHSLRKRIFETQRARNELDWQRLKMRDEMEKCINEIRTLESALRDKTNTLKLAETRLENRAQRSGMELCLDDPYEKLCSEVFQLRKIKQALSDQVDAAKETYNSLESHAQRIETDLNNKQHSMMTDIRGLDLRSKLKDGGVVSCLAAPTTQTDRNLQLTKMENEIPPT